MHRPLPGCARFFFFFNDTATTEIYTLSLHDALPIRKSNRAVERTAAPAASRCPAEIFSAERFARSEEHTSELQSHPELVCRLLLEKKNQPINFKENQPQTGLISQTYEAKKS